MGVSCLLFTLNDETADWLRENNVPLPCPLPKSRLPTLGELKSIVERLDGYTAKVGLSSVANSVDIEVVDQRGDRAGWSTTIWVKKVGDRTRSPDDGDVVQFSFDNGSPELAVLIVEKLAHICGPLVLMLEVDCRPLLVTEGIDPLQAVAKWLND
jgi:hypothetical protein